MRNFKAEEIEKLGPEKLNRPAEESYKELPTVRRNQNKLFTAKLEASVRTMKLRKSVMQHSQNQSRVSEPDPMEEEKFQLTQGMCFGEWALAYNIPRTASAYTLENTDLFYLDKDAFDVLLSRTIIKSDVEKKNFISKKIPPLNHYSKIQDVMIHLIPMVCLFLNLVFWPWSDNLYRI